MTITSLVLLTVVLVGRKNALTNHNKDDVLVMSRVLKSYSVLLDCFLVNILVHWVLFDEFTNTYVLLT